MDDKMNDKKVYKFCFSPLMLTVFISGIILCIACFALSTWQFSGFITGGDLSSVWEWIKYLLLYFVSVFLAVLLVAMLVRSQYVITDKFLITKFGIIVTKYELKKIRSLCLLNGSKKLYVYFDDFKTKFMTIVVKEEWHDDFIKTLTAKNERIEFDFISAEDEQKKNGKK